MSDSEAQIVKQGVLLKKGEYIRNWRPRWFQLKSDGSFHGYKTGPPAPGDQPQNYFCVNGSTLVLTDDGKPKGSKGKKFGFMIRFMQLTRFVERSFHTESEDERNEWIKAYEEVKRKTMAEQTVSAEEKQSQLEDSSMTLDDFDLLKVLGKGTFGTVMLAREKSTKELFAIKILKKEVILEKDEVSHILTENTVLQSTKHPFLTSLKCSFQTADKLCFVMEYVNGGELFFHLSKEKKFTEDRTRFYIAEIILALTYLHDHNIIYRDLKLENLLLDRHGHIKITDFGLCKEEITYGATTTTFCGTPEYLAPEILEDNDYGRSVDWWGVGVVMYEMSCGHLPFYNRNHEVLFDLILHEEIRLPPEISPELKDLLTKLLTKDPTKRLGSGKDDGREIMSHPFFKPIDFQKLYDRKIAPPFVPRIKGEDDVSNFDPMFTSESVVITPPEEQAPVDDNAFEGFDAVATN